MKVWILKWTSAEGKEVSFFSSQSHALQAKANLDKDDEDHDGPSRYTPAEADEPYEVDLDEEIDKFPDQDGEQLVFTSAESK